MAPSLSGQAIAMYPATLRSSFVTRVIKFVNDTEQRWVVRGRLFSAVLQLHDLNGYDTSLLVNFFNTMRGEYVDAALTNVFDITIDGVQYFWCVFDQDVLQVQEEPGLKYSFQMAIRQLRPN